MLRWALKGSDAIKVASTGNAAHDLKALYKTGEETVLGKVDRINNIYDLEGNALEWTMVNYVINRGANPTSYARALRGGTAFSSSAPSRISGDYIEPKDTSGGCSSRIILYIK